MGDAPISERTLPRQSLFSPMLRLLYTQATTAARSAPSRVPMPVSAPTRRLLHDGPGLAMAHPRAHPYLVDGGPSADYLQRSRIRGSGWRDVLWAKRFRFCSGAPPRSRRRRTASREFAQRVDSRSVREMRTAKPRSFPRKRESRPRTWVPATGSPRRERRGVPLAGTRREGWFLPLPGNQNTHSSVVVYSAARTLASKPYGLRASLPRDQDAGIDRDHPPRDFATARRDRIGTDYGRSNAEAPVAYRTIQSHCKAGKGSLNSQGLGVALARAAHRRQTRFLSIPAGGADG